MGRSSTERGARSGDRLDRLDRLALGGIALGLGLYVMPFWAEGRLRPAFWLTLASTALHVYTSHASTPRLKPPPGGTGA